ncbi:MAG: transcription-repair coupling factor [Chthoniobacter sp.]|nr:transcription-repair coupling factor [Chthoniobacter sp.]
MPPKSDLLDELAASPPLAEKLGVVRTGAAAVAFEQVVESARPVLAALLARVAKGRVWIVCRDVRAQETMYNELLHWHPDALFFPEADQAPVEGALPDPETAAERLALVQTLAGSRKKEIVVLTHGSLHDDVPTPAALKKLEIKLARGARLDRAVLLAQLAKAGYEHAPTVAARGQYAVRGGILDVFSFHHTLPVRVELFDDEIESLREFDLDTQTSVRHVDTASFLLGDATTAAKPTATTTLRELIRAEDLTVDAGADFKDARVRILEGSFAAEGCGDGEDGITELEERGGTSFTSSQFGNLEKFRNSVSSESSGEAGKESSLDFSPQSPDTGLKSELLCDFTTAFLDHGLGEFEAGDFVVDEMKRERFFAQLRAWRTDGWSVHIFCNNEGEVERLNDLIPPVEADPLRFTIGPLARGFVFPTGKIAVLSDAELFGRYRNNRARRLALRRARDQAQRTQIDFSELNEDDLVVHLEHGIGRYEGMKSIPSADGKTEEVLVIAFADDARLYVPLEQSFLISRYVGVGKRNPQLSQLGDGKWAKAKKSAEKAVFDYASKLLAMHAEREIAQGFAFPPDSKWQHEFEASFLFKETADQLTAIAATKADMESERPMDRLICGDVGFGKTEVAIRAAFKAVTAGKQVAILVPTTVLAQQHYQNFRERFSDYPMSVETLSRFRSPAEQRKTLEGLRDGSVDVVVGTHRLISKDVAFKNLGLVVIDEEQRFGVLHKERFKEMFQLVDMLTLSATPIPRTLYLSLMGAKDMSTIETPPLNRIPTDTLICPYDERIIRDAINRELARQGQVYFLHNRVQSIEKVRDRIAQLCPKARLVIGHGQMDEHELEDVMQQFVSAQADVLISTTIIESGLDIPNANTIIIDRADRFGLADLYQLRGRVGRAQHKAYAYLLLPRDMLSGGEARKRINAIKQYSSLGAGFKIAMRDLEIRGAGNILGTAQSGHIVSIGFDLYCSLLRQAVSKLKGEKVRPRLDVVLRTDFVVLREAEWGGAESGDGKADNGRKLAAGSSPAERNRRGWIPVLPAKPDLPAQNSNPRGGCAAFLPAAYIAESQPRIQAYRRLAEVNTQEQLDALRKTWRDRFGPLPEAAENLLALTEIKLAAAARKIAIVEAKDGKLMLTRNGDFILIGGKFPRLTAPEPTPRLREMLAMLRSL